MPSAMVMHTNANHIVIGANDEERIDVRATIVRAAFAQRVKAFSEC